MLINCLGISSCLVLNQNSKYKASNDVNNQLKQQKNTHNNQVSSKSESKTKKSEINLAIQNAVKSNIKINGKNITNMVNISSISKNKTKEELCNSNKNSILLSCSNNSKTNVLSEEVILFENKPNHNATKLYENKNLKFIDFKMNSNHNKEIFYLSDEEKNFSKKKPNCTDYMIQENELLITSIPSPKECFIKNKYKYLLENYMKTTSITSNGI